MECSLATEFSSITSHHAEANHLSPGKITNAVANIKAGLQNKLVLGNLDARRDWGYAKEYVEAMWLMLQQPEPDDYVIATGELHSVQDFLEEAASYQRLNWADHVEIDKKFFRPLEVDLLIGDATKAKEKLGWAPKTTFKQLVHLMVDADLAKLGSVKAPAGFVQEGIKNVDFSAI